MSEAQVAIAPTDLLAVRQQAGASVVGREGELDLLLSAISGNCDIMLEGPPGASKTTMLRAITGAWGIPMFFVEGNSDLTPSRLVGYHDPSRVMREGYVADSFVPGPLLEAMQAGGFLYIEELNRSPDDTLNVLLGAMADRRIAVPRLGMIEAQETFRIVAAINPFDNVGTTPLSRSVHDRLCRLAIDYQGAEDERIIVRRQATCESDLRDTLVADAVAVTRATRTHRSLQHGSSVRGAIACVEVAARLAALRRVDGSTSRDGYAALFYEAMCVALSGRVRVEDSVEVPAELVLREIWEDHFVLDHASAEPG